MNFRKYQELNAVMDRTVPGAAEAYDKNEVEEPKACGHDPVDLKDLRGIGEADGLAMIEEAKKPRYEVHLVANVFCDSIEATVEFASDDLEQAERNSADIDSFCGSAILDTHTGKIDFGEGFGVPIPEMEKPYASDLLMPYKLAADDYAGIRADYFRRNVSTLSTITKMASIMGCGVAAGYFTNSLVKGVVVGIGVIFLYQLAKLEGNAEGYIKGYGAGYDGGIVKILGVKKKSVDKSA